MKSNQKARSIWKRVKRQDHRGPDRSYEGCSISSEKNRIKFFISWCHCHTPVSLLSKKRTRSICGHVTLFWLLGNVLYVVCWDDNLRNTQWTTISDSAIKRTLIKARTGSAVYTGGNVTGGTVVVTGGHSWISHEILKPTRHSPEVWSGSLTFQPRLA